MSGCEFCGRECNCRGRLLLLKKRRVISASNYKLRRKSHYHRLAMSTRAIMEDLGISRRKLPDWMTMMIYTEDILFFHEDGRPLELPSTSIDDAFNGDGSFRWISDFINHAEQFPKQCPQERILRRLQLIDLSIRVAYPERARLIAK